MTKTLELGIALERLLIVTIEGVVNYATILGIFLLFSFQKKNVWTNPLFPLGNLSRAGLPTIAFFKKDFPLSSDSA